MTDKKSIKDIQNEIAETVSQILLHLEEIKKKAKNQEQLDAINRLEALFSSVNKKAFSI